MEYSTDWLIDEIVELFNTCDELHYVLEIFAIIFTIFFI